MFDELLRRRKHGFGIGRNDGQHSRVSCPLAHMCRHDERARAKPSNLTSVPFFLPVLLPVVIDG